MRLFDGVERNASAHPQLPAVRLGNETLTYGDLDRQGNQFANTLVEVGVVRGDRVALYGHKTPEMIVALFGILKAGAAYVPINPDAPPDYVTGVLEDCDVSVIVGTQSRAARIERVAERRHRVIGPDVDIEGSIGFETIQRTAPTDAPGIDVSPDDLGYIIFTSGSTGRPKGIMHSHRSGMAYGRVVSSTFEFDARDRMALHAPLNFDLSTVELFGGTLVGAEIVIVSEGHARLPASFGSLLDEAEITIVNAVPSALSQLVHRGAIDSRDLSSIRLVLFGGEVFPTRDLRSLRHRLPQARFANVYGPAEVNGVTYQVVSDLPDDDSPISIGGPYPEVELLVVDEHDQPVPDGDQGELLASAPTRMIGYWNQPDLTERSWHRTADTVYYRTGDLVRRSPDGTYSFHGRKDRQVKVRGHRLELDEIETALIGHPGVEQAVVYVITSESGSDEIHATVVPLPDGPAPEPSEVRSHAGRVLPAYAVPSEIVIATDVPRTHSGKPDRVALMTEIANRR